MKKVLILADALDNQNAGVHFYLSEFLNALDEIDLFETEITILREKNVFQYKRIKTMVISSTKFGPLNTAFRYFVRIPAHVIFNKFDYVFEPAHFGPFNLPKRVKRITFIHDLTPIHFPQNHTFRGWFLQKLFLKSILKNANFVITNSKWTRDDVVKNFPFTQKKTTYSYLGVPNRFKSKQPTKINRIAEKYFLVVGSLEPRKGLITILEAFQMFKEKSRFKTKLFFLGPKGWKNEDFYTKLENHPYKSDIFLSGYVSNDELKALYLSAQCLIYASEYEGFGLPIVEAAFYNTVSIVARNSSLIEVGSICGSAFFETSNHQQLGEEMLKHSIEKKEVPNKSKIMEIFSWEKHCIDFLNVLNLT